MSFLELSLSTASSSLFEMLSSQSDSAASSVVALTEFTSLSAIWYLQRIYYNEQQFFFIIEVYAS